MKWLVIGLGVVGLLGLGVLALAAWSAYQAEDLDDLFDCGGSDDAKASVKNLRIVK